MKRSIANPNLIIERLTALGDVTRLRILRLLEAEALSVGEVAKVVPLPPVPHRPPSESACRRRPGSSGAAGPADLHRLVPGRHSGRCPGLVACPASRWAERRTSRISAPAPGGDRRAADQQPTFFRRYAGGWDHPPPAMTSSVVSSPSTFAPAVAGIGPSRTLAAAPAMCRSCFPQLWNTSLP